MRCQGGGRRGAKVAQQGAVTLYLVPRLALSRSLWQIEDNPFPSCRLAKVVRQMARIHAIAHGGACSVERRNRASSMRVA